jgi:hypothetical protein
LALSGPDRRPSGLLVEKDSAEREAAAQVTGKDGTVGLARGRLVDGEDGHLSFEALSARPDSQRLDRIAQVLGAELDVPADQATACGGFQPGLEARRPVARATGLALYGGHQGSFLSCAAAGAQNEGPDNGDGSLSQKAVAPSWQRRTAVEA